jgi:hypothetical protein
LVYYKIENNCENKKEHFMRLTRFILFEKIHEYTYTQIRLGVVFEKVLSLCRLYNVLSSHLVPTCALRGATGVSEIVN